MGENYHRTDVLGVSLNSHIEWALGRTAFGVDLRREQIYSTAYGELLSPDKQISISGSERKYERKRRGCDFYRAGQQHYDQARFAGSEPIYRASHG